MKLDLNTFRMFGAEFQTRDTLENCLLLQINNEEFHHLKPTIHPNNNNNTNTEEVSYRTVNTHTNIFKNINRLLLYIEIIAICCENYTERMSVL